MDNTKQEIASPEPSGDFQHVAENMKSSAYEVLNSADFNQQKEVENVPLEVDSDSSNADSVPELVPIENEEIKQSAEVVEPSTKGETENDQVVSEDTADPVDEAEIPEAALEDSPAQEAKKPVDPYHWQDVLGSGRLYTKIMVEGGEETVKNGDLVKIEISVPVIAQHLRFGSSVDNDCELKHHETLEVLLGDGFAIPAIELACYEAKVGGSIAVKSHDSLRKTLPMEFVLKIVEKLEKNHLKLANDFKSSGNEAWKASDIETALKHYQNGLKQIQEFISQNEQTEETKELFEKLMKNAGRCFFKKGENKRAIGCFREVLAIYPDNLSVLALIADIEIREKNYEEVLKIIAKVRVLEAGSEEKKYTASMEKHEERCRRELKKQDVKQKQMYSKMFSGASESPVVQKSPKKTQSAPSDNQKTEENSAEKDEVSSGLIIGATICAIAAIGVALWYRNSS
ncbi:Oidioi.mRNA.OKI2018_I69.chr1.g3037.t1.cds [Oikopleura dioica]|uniref:Oidioi.mRNA.OKI2018_I69.chr1.g3037.t1.cds n=1 Tax=Oikopleura dioica TaxID=34765 RepID=A0ABN7SUN7_OIKDI|nr:Oidioi.mRNA.OKI2018_I69.chr1.g3037.t1.cds [Oikopleura dioica]